MRTSFDPRAPGLQGLEWDSAELFRVSVCPSTYAPVKHKHCMSTIPKLCSLCKSSVVLFCAEGLRKHCCIDS